MKNWTFLFEVLFLFRLFSFNNLIRYIKKVRLETGKMQILFTKSGKV